jgi:hypothetical protein
MTQLKRSVETVKPLKKQRQRKDGLALGIKLYRRISKIISKKGAFQKAKPWRSADHYTLKNGETWTDLWAYDVKKPTKDTKTFWFPLLLHDSI